MSIRDKSAQGRRLDRLQRWTQAVITHPGGIDAGVISEDARRSMYVDLDMIEEVVASSAGLTASERLAVYWRSYHARLLQCFREMFPALLHALGEELFKMFALDYLERHPPHSYTLDRLADAFPQHLAETRPDAAAPRGSREDWPDFIIDLAMIEWAFMKVYDGPGIEGRRAPDARDIAAIGDQRLLDARPVRASCLRLFELRYPVHRYMLAARRGEGPQLPAPAETFLAMTRQNYRVTMHELTSSQHAFLHFLDGQSSVAGALERCARITGSQMPRFAAIRDWLCEWADRGFFESVENGRETNH